MITTFRTMNICVFSNIPNLTKELRHILPSLTFKEVIAGWGGVYKSTLYNLKVAQKLILKIILRKEWRVNSDELFTQAEVMDIRQLFSKIVLQKLFFKPNLANNQIEETIYVTRNKTNKILNIPSVKKEHDSDENLQNSEIIIGDFDLVAPHIYNLPKLKWLQGTWAGLDAIMPYVNKPLPFLLTRFSGHNFGRMMTEYIITHIVTHERDFNAIDNNQRTKAWSQNGKIQDYRVISDLTIGILGIGNIGSWIGRSLNTLGAQVLGYGRKPSLKISDLNNFIDQYYTKSSLPEFLKRSDYIINTLPTTPETTGLLNGDLLENCRERKSIFINVGRGTIIDENDLICALKNGWLSKAILDVFQTEPLPKDSPLWTMDQVKITPHVSAVSKPRHIAEQFQENWKLYKDNQPISTTVNLECGY